MSITAKTRKILWARAGNQCAFSGCRQDLVEKDQGVGPDIVVGEEAHILPRSRNGPRGCEWDHKEKLDSYSNHILLCPTHHRIIDHAPETFTKQCLVDMKSAHEWRVASERRWAERFQSVGVTAHGLVGQGVHIWHVGDSIVVGDSYGSPPIRLDHDHWRAGGMRIGQLLATGDAHWLFDSSEAEPDIEYWPSGSRFYVVQEVHLYDENHFAPFIKHEFDLTKVPAVSKVELLLDEDPALAEGIPTLVKKIWSIERKNYSGRFEALLQLWRAGLSDPDRVCEEFLRFKTARWCDGETGEVVASMIRELVLVQRAKANN